MLENFEASAMNPSVWSLFIDGIGPTAVQKDGYLEVTIPTDTREAEEPHSFGGGYKSVKCLRGDFDIQVDYHLLDWPEGSGIRMGIGLFPVKEGQMGNVQRGSYGPPENGPQELYATDFQTSGGGIPTRHQSGALRLTRVEHRMTSGVMVDGRWVEMHTGDFSTDDYHFAITAWSHDRCFSKQVVRVGFDNFIVRYGELVEPGSPETPRTSAERGEQSYGSPPPAPQSFGPCEVIMVPSGQPFYKMPQVSAEGAPARIGPYRNLRIELPNKDSGLKPIPKSEEKQ